MARKKLKARTKIEKKQRLIDLEVDEVSLVDKPAIGEPVYLTKSLDEGEDSMATKKKKRLKKKAEDSEEIIKNQDEEASEESLEDEEVASEDDDSTDDSSEEAVGKNNDSDPDDEEEDEEEEDEEEEDEEDGGDEDEEEDEDEEAAEKATELLVKRIVKAEVKKNLADVEDMLTQSLQLHENVGLALNEILALNMSALDMVMVMVAEDSDDDMMSEEQQAMVTDIRDSIKSVDVKKAGAKISRSRLRTLRDIAAKLTELITSVDDADAESTKGAGKGRKKSLAKSLETINDLTERLEKAEEGVESLRKRYVARS